MRVGAVIVSYRTGPALSSCLDSVAHAEGIEEIIVVDNGNSVVESEAIDAFARTSAKARVLRGQGNVGFAAGANLGARRARSETLLFLNPDVELSPDAISRLLNALQEAPPPAIVGGDLRDASGQPDRGARRERLTLWRAFVSFTGLSRFERSLSALRDFNRHRDPMPTKPTPVGAVSGAILCMRRTDFEILGGFDERYFLHVEDIDLCRRAEAAGWRVLFAPGPHGIHARSTSDVPAAEVERHKARSFSRYFMKFATSPWERIMASMIGAVLWVILPLRAGR